MKTRILTLALLSATVLAGCASTNAQPTAEEAYTPPARQFVTPQGEEYAREQFRVYDPAEGVNRGIYKFNAKFDKYVFLPVVKGYDTVVPEYVDNRISSFFSNIGEFRNATNSLLQAKPKKTATAVGRFAINTTVGILGFYDPATKIGLKQHKEDFGQTLGHWGVGPGAYVMLPILGPSNVRDTVGIVGDALAFSAAVPNDTEDTVTYKVVQYGVRPVNTRANNSFRYNGTGSPFEYDLVRYITTETRRLAVEQ
jgi:phospholipid-binding lipoprotein MlaA